MTHRGLQAGEEEILNRFSELCKCNSSVKSLKFRQWAEFADHQDQKSHSSLAGQWAPGADNNFRRFL